MVSAKWLEGIDPQAPAESAMELLLDRQSAALRASLAGVSHCGLEDIESIHRVRVASRRIAVILDLFGQSLVPATSDQLGKRLHKLRKRCGAARDLDVERLFLESLLCQAASNQRRGLIFLIERNVADRLGVQTQLRDVLPQQIKKLEQSLARLLREFSSRPINSDPIVASQRLGSFASFGARLVPGILQEFWSKAAGIELASRRLHELRIACKKLRYRLEILAPVLDRGFHEVFYPDLQRVQELLGRIQDATVGLRSLKVARRDLKELSRARCKQARRERTAILPGLRGVRGAYIEMQDSARQKLRDLWPQYSTAEMPHTVPEEPGTVLDEQTQGLKSEYFLPH